MRMIRLGRTGVVVSEVGLGTRSFGDSMDEDDCARVLDRYEDEGGNLLDTAVTYAEGRSEELLGRLLSGGRRDRFFLSTKFGLRRNTDDVNAAGVSRRNLRRSLDESLLRLRTDYVDILWLHAWYPGIPAEEFLRAARDEVARGRVLNIGVSNAPAWWIAHVHTLADARMWEPMAGIQIEYSLGQREAERELLPMATELHLAVLAWSPLGRGRLLRDVPQEARTGVSSAETRRQRELRTALVTVGRSMGISPAAVAVSWVTGQGAVPLVGARTAAHVQEIAVAALHPLATEHREQLDQASCPDVSELRKLLEGVQERADPAAVMPPPRPLAAPHRVVTNAEGTGTLNDN